MPDEPRKEFVRSGCEACILARVGGDVQAVIDLRASCLGRTRKRRQKPRLLGIIEGWIGRSGERERVEEESYSICREVKEIRRDLQKERRQREEERRKGKRNGRAGNDRSRRHSPEVLENERGRKAPDEHDSWNDIDGSEDREHDVGDVPEDDFESRIISHYRNLFSTTSLDVHTGSLAHEEYLHSDFRESITFHPKDGTFHRRQPDSICEMDGASDPSPSASDRRHAERTSGAYGTGPYTVPILLQALSPRTQQHQTTYTQSIYSRDSGLGIGSSSSRHRTDSPERAAHHAEAYRKLVGIPEILEAHIGVTERRECSVDCERRRRDPGVGEYSAHFEGDEELADDERWIGIETEFGGEVEEIKLTRRESRAKQMTGWIDLIREGQGRLG
jgi:hypothetical protein